MKFVGEININRVFKCASCGNSLWGDHGVVSKTGPKCIDRMKCNLRVARQRLSLQAAQGLKPRWR